MSADSISQCPQCLARAKLVEDKIAALTGSATIGELKALEAERAKTNTLQTFGQYYEFYFVGNKLLWDYWANCGVCGFKVSVKGDKEFVLT